MSRVPRPQWTPSTNTHRPDYLLLLGAPDVVPHIQLTNPMTGTPDDDDDPGVPSDVPYASTPRWCQAPAELRRSNAGRRTRARSHGRERSCVPRQAADCRRAVHATRSNRLLRAFCNHREGVDQVRPPSRRRISSDRAPTVLTSPPLGSRTGRRVSWRRACTSSIATATPCHAGVFRRGSERKIRRCARRGASALTRHKGFGDRCRMLLRSGALRSQRRCRTSWHCQHVPGRRRTRLLRQHEHRLRSVRRSGTGRSHLPVPSSSRFKRARHSAARRSKRGSDSSPSFARRSVGSENRCAVRAARRPVAATDQGHAACIRANEKRVERVSKSGAFHPETRAFRRERLVRAGSNLSRTLGTAVPTKTRVPAGVLRFLTQAARESGIRKRNLQQLSVSFPLLRRRPR